MIEAIENNHDAAMAALVLVFILGDIVTGLIKAGKSGCISSTKMREGLFHKMGLIGALVLGYMCEAATIVFDLPDEFTVIYAGIAVYILILEAESMYENLCAVSPELAESPIAQLFDVENDAAEAVEGVGNGYDLPEKADSVEGVD